MAACQLNVLIAFILMEGFYFQCRLGKAWNDNIKICSLFKMHNFWLYRYNVQISWTKEKKVREKRRRKRGLHQVHLGGNWCKVFGAGVQSPDLPFVSACMQVRSPCDSEASLHWSICCRKHQTGTFLRLILLAISRRCITDKRSMRCFVWAK